MRELKFRAWDRELRGMISPDLFDDLLNGKEVAWSESRKRKVPSKVTEVPFVDLSSGTHGVTRHVDGYEDVTENVRMRSYKGNPFALRGLDIMQYTGLDDNCGRPLYEGDIITNNGVTNDMKRRLFEIIWSGSKARFVLYDRRANMRTSMDSFDVRQCEMVGNVHENPDLRRADKGSI